MKKPFWNILLFLALVLALPALAQASVVDGSGSALPSTCTNGQVITWNSTTGQWGTCSDLTGGGDVTGPASPVTNSLVKFTGTGKGTDNAGAILGTLTNGYYCTYTSAGTLISCNTQYTVANNLIFGSDAQYDIPIRGASSYGRLPTSAGMQSFLGLAVTVSGNNVTLPGTLETTAADGARGVMMPSNTAFPACTAAGVPWAGCTGSGTGTITGIANVGGVLYGVSNNGTPFIIPNNPIGGTLGATTNVIPKSNGTGTATLQPGGITEDGTNVSLGALNLVTTGTIQGGMVISSDADGMTGAEMTAVGMYGTLFIATGAGTWTLPTAAAGMFGCLADSGTAHDLILDVQADDDIQLKGTEQANGVGITNASGSTTGDFVCFVAISAGHWMTLGMQGTWASQ